MTDPQHSPWGLTESDDELHPVDPGEALWTETVWFAFMVPERGLLGYLYPVFRPNLGIQFGGVVVAGPGGETPWEIPIYHWQQHVPIAPDLRLSRLSLPSGLEIAATRPGRTFALTYRSRELSLDLTYEALMRPLLSGGGSNLFAGGGHLDQPGRVTGQLELHGETIAVDCLAMRDRAWGPRRDKGQMRVGYAYATASADSAFLSISHIVEDGQDRVWTGYLMRGGVWSRLVAGTREVERDASGRPVAIRIDATDEAGRHVSATGTARTRMIYAPYPSMMAWISLVEWTLDGATCWGEDQDVWSPRRWRLFTQARRSGADPD